MYLKELKYYFSSPVAYIVIGLYLLVIGLFLWVVPGEWNIPDSGYAQVDGLFSLSPWLMMLLCPALTMRLMSDEWQTGTWNILRSQPISLARIMLSKFFAAWTVVVIALLPTVVHYFLVKAIAEPVGNVDGGAFFGSFVGLLLISLAFTSLSLFASSFSQSQILNFVVAFLCCFVFFYGFELIGSLISSYDVRNVVEWFGLNHHYVSMSRGVIDLRDVVYFLSVSAVFVLSAIKLVEHKSRK